MLADHMALQKELSNAVISGILWAYDSLMKCLLMPNCSRAHTVTETLQLRAGFSPDPALFSAPFEHVLFVYIWKSGFIGHKCEVNLVYI